MAAEYLKSLNYKIISRNYRTPYGEIDIIAEDGETVVFVEVKTRSSRRYGDGLEAITAKKGQTMMKCAEFYLAGHGIDGFARIDVISIDMSSAKKLTHIKGALE